MGRAKGQGPGARGQGQGTGLGARARGQEPGLTHPAQPLLKEAQEKLANVANVLPRIFRSSSFRSFFAAFASQEVLMRSLEGFMPCFDLDQGLNKTNMSNCSPVFVCRQLVLVHSLVWICFAAVCGCGWQFTVWQSWQCQRQVETRTKFLKFPHWFSGVLGKLRVRQQYCWTPSA